LKKNSFLIVVVFITTLFIACSSAYGQISSGGTPPSIKYQIHNDNFKLFAVNPPDLQTLQEEDRFDEKYGMPYRFSVSTSVEIDFCKQGTWTSLPGGAKMCRLAVNSPGAEALIVYYSTFKIPEGGELFLYNTRKSQIIGAFTSFNNKDGGAFSNEMIEGDVVSLEYFQPSFLKEAPEIIISEIGHVYRSSGFVKTTRGFGGSDTCEVNINCAEGTNWQQQKSGVTRIIVKQGNQQVWCTGTLLNNARQNGTPYFLTADHCGANASPADYDQWIFYFRYEGPDCVDPVSDTAFKNYTMVGASKKAAAGGAGVLSDFKLLLLNESVPDNYNPFYVGWNISNEPSAEGVTIHHPQGDIKKISTYITPLVSTNWSGTPNTHWKVVWAETETNWGVTEGGSSGCPIFNNLGHLVGQLTGGDASCYNLTGPDYYGKIWYSWNQCGNVDSTQLRPWLDPDNSGITSLNGASFVGIGENKPFNEIDVFPNPVKGELFVNIPGSEGKEYVLKVFDIIGNQVFLHSGKVHENGQIRLDLAGIQNGYYLLQIEIDRTYFSSKVIRQ